MNTNGMLTVDSAPVAVAQPVINEICDACGGSVRANHMAVKSGFELFFCTHHAIKNIQSLTSDGFTVTPPPAY